MIYWIDDESDILEMVDMYFGSKIAVKTLHHWDNLPKLECGDIVIHDCLGVGRIPDQIEGVKYFSCSGRNDAPCDFSKPFDVKHILSILKERQMETFIEYGISPAVLTDMEGWFVWIEVKGGCAKGKSNVDWYLLQEDAQNRCDQLNKLSSKVIDIRKELV